RRVGERRAVETDKRGRVQHGWVLANFIDSLANNFIGSIERCTRRKLKCRNQIASIKLRDEAGRRRAQLAKRERDQPAINNQDDEGNSNKASGQPAIALRQRCKDVVEFREQSTRRAQAPQPGGLWLIMMGLEQDRSQRGRERQRDECRNHRRRGDGDGKLLVERSLQPADKGRREEYGAQNECNRY